VVYITNPAILSCVMAFFSDPYSPFEIFNFFITLVYILFCIHLWIMLRVETVHVSITKIHKFLNTHPAASKCLTKILQERMTRILKDQGQ